MRQNNFQTIFSRPVIREHSLFTGPVKRGDFSVDHHAGSENQNHQLLLVPSLCLEYQFRSSVFP